MVLINPATSAEQTWFQTGPAGRVGKDARAALRHHVSRPISSRSTWPPAPQAAGPATSATAMDGQRHERMFDKVSARVTAHLSKSPGAVERDGRCGVQADVRPSTRSFSFEQRRRGHSTDMINDRVTVANVPSPAEAENLVSP